jgi:hypothetical protein
MLFSRGLIASDPVDGAEEIPLADRHAPMAQNIVGRRHEKEEVWQRKLLQIIGAVQLQLSGAGRPRDRLFPGLIDLCCRQGLYEA